jgi:hypothetical protein
MCFRITAALREYYRYEGVSADIERRGYGSSKPALAWASRYSQPQSAKPLRQHWGFPFESRRAGRHEQLTGMTLDVASELVHYVPPFQRRRWISLDSYL